ncbi:MAG TPA: hypothetical protein VGN37_00540 [Actinocatenispora sp.]|nr:hypothetical protein [Kribbella sp.]
MALNNGEAHVVNTLLDYFLHIDSRPTGPVTDRQAQEAAQLLATKAYKQLYAGIRPEEVTKHWTPRVEPDPLDQLTAGLDAHDANEVRKFRAFLKDASPARGNPGHNPIRYRAAIHKHYPDDDTALQEREDENR